MKKLLYILAFLLLFTSFAYAQNEIKTTNEGGISIPTADVIGAFTAGTVASDGTVTANGAVLTGDTNTFDITSGTGSLNVAAGKTVDFDMDFKVDGTGTTITGVTQANTITLNESLTIGGGANFTLTAEDTAGIITLDEQTLEVEGQGDNTQLTKLVNANDAAATLTIEGTSGAINQDLTTDASVTFATITSATQLLPAPTGQAASGEKDVYTVDSGAAHTVFGQPYYFASDGELECASVADPNSPNLAVVLAITTGTGASKTCLKRGQIRNAAEFSFTLGSYVYLSDDPNTPWTQTAPTAVQVIGLCEDDPNQFYFNPQPFAVK